MIIVNRVITVIIITIILTLFSSNNLIISELNQEEDAKEVFPNYNPGFQTGSIFSPQTLAMGGSVQSGTFTCAIYENGSLYCSGWNTVGQLGLGYVNINPSSPSNAGNTVPKFVNLGSNNSANSIHIGEGGHACAILMNMELRCWGDNWWGQVGAGFRSNSTSDAVNSLTSPQIVDLGVNRKAITVAIAEHSTCAVLDNGNVKCWGYNANGELGRGFESEYEATPDLVDFGSGRTAKAITAGKNFFCAILDDNSLRCWGDNWEMQLSHPIQGLNQATPINITLPSSLDVVAVSAGSYHVCAVTEIGTLYCWGDIYANSEYYSLPRYMPQQQYLGENRTAIAIDSKYDHTCVILDDDGTPNRVFCFGGDNQHSVLGYSSTTLTNLPQHNSSINRIRFISNSTSSPDGQYHADHVAGIVTGLYTSCFVLDNSSMYCWGKMADGGGMTTNTDWGSPSPVDSNLPLGLYLPDRDFDNDGIINIFDTNFVGDTDGDGIIDSLDSDPNNPVFGIYCDAGSYGRYTCLNSEPGHYVPSQGYVFQVKCSPGYYNPYYGSTNNSNCLESSKGHYVDISAAVSQTPCPLGTHNPDFGAKSLSSCIDSTPGHYVDFEGAGYQIACFYGQYQPLFHSISCIDADPGYFVNTISSISQQPCEIGYYQTLTGQSTCINSDPGYFVNTTAAIMQKECLVGTYSPDFAASKCSNASIGYYVDTNASSSQTPCPAFNSTLDIRSVSVSQCKIDTDADLLPNSIDDDDDGDGYSDGFDYFPLNSLEWADSDLDGIGNNEDVDDDNDGWLDFEELTCDSDPLRELLIPDDTDEDTLCDNMDPDIDGDSIINLNDAFPMDKTEWEDSDFDGIGNNQDIDDDNDNWLDTTEIECESDPENFLSTPFDYDNDFICNLMDQDDDNDLVLDINDFFPQNSFEWSDNDLDGIGDNEDNDDDNDGYLDLNDLFPMDSFEWSDRDSDGIGDFSDLDNDNDGWPDSDEYNCSTNPYLTISFPQDDDNDGVCNFLDNSGNYISNEMLFYVNIILITLLLILIILTINRKNVSKSRRNKRKIKKKKTKKKVGPSSPPPKKNKKKVGPSSPTPKKTKKKVGPSSPPPKKTKKKVGPSSPPPKKTKKKVRPSSPPPKKTNEKIP